MLYQSMGIVPLLQKKKNPPPKKQTFKIQDSFVIASADGYHEPRNDSAGVLVVRGGRQGLVVVSESPSDS
jgi:hypothetical protein